MREIKANQVYYWQSQNDDILPDEIILILCKHQYLNKFWYYAYESIWGTEYSLLHERYIKLMTYVGELK